jgi:hypothetical protein
MGPLIRDRPQTKSQSYLLLSDDESTIEQVCAVLLSSSSELPLQTVAPSECVYWMSTEARNILNQNVVL